MLLTFHTPHFCTVLLWIPRDSLNKQWLLLHTALTIWPCSGDTFWCNLSFPILVRWISGFRGLIYDDKNMSYYTIIEGGVYITLHNQFRNVILYMQESWLFKCKRKIFYSHPRKEMVQLLFQLCYICPTATKNSSEWSFKEAKHLVRLLQNSKVNIILNIITLILQIFCSILHFDHKWNIHCLEIEIYKIMSEVSNQY